ncbi:MAG: hypothetical protein HZA59_12345 [Hydrogenophilales bacterium]|nr:hypothetical protein [Hydrogenophilales bacterium]
MPKKKLTKKKGTPFTGRPVGRLPCVARQTGRLRNSRDPLRGHALKQVLAEFPGPAALLGGSQGPQGQHQRNISAL